MNLKKYIAWRTVHMAITLLIVLVLLFLLFRLMPGNAAQALVVKPGITEYEKNEILIRYGLSKRVDMPGDYFVGSLEATRAGRYEVDVTVQDRGGTRESVSTYFEVAADAADDNIPPAISAVSTWRDPASGDVLLNATVSDNLNVGSVYAFVYSSSEPMRELMSAPLASNDFSVGLSGLANGQYYANIVALDVNRNNATAVVSFAVGAAASGATIYGIDASEYVISAGVQTTVTAEVVNALSAPEVVFVSPDGTSNSVAMTLVSGNHYSAPISPATAGDYQVWVSAGGDYDAFQRVRVNPTAAIRPSPVDGPAGGLDVTGLTTESDSAYPYKMSSTVAPGGAVRVTVNLTAKPHEKMTTFVNITTPDGTVQNLYVIHPTKVVPRPMYEQFAYYMKSMLLFDFGNSFANNQPVWDEILDKIPATLWLFGNALIFAYVIGISIGMIIAWRRGTALELGTIVVTLFFYSMPIFWFALLSQWIFYTQLHWLPIGGMGGFDDMGNPYTGFAYVKDMLWHLILPLLTLTVLHLAGDILLMRTSMLEVLGEDFVTTARAKGLKERTIMYKHAARNAMLPVVTSLAMAISGVISGGVLTETIFSWPGMGSLLIRATLTTDFPVVQGAFYILAILTIVGNMAADILYAYLDPRVQL
jgi:peptide/nickel transport system permease protein